MYGSHPLSEKSRTLKADGQRFACAKAHRRLFIQDLETGELLYTPPDFIRLTSRTPLEDLARVACAKTFLDIADIVFFESQAPRGAGYRKRSTR